MKATLHHNGRRIGHAVRGLMLAAYQDLKLVHPTRGERQAVVEDNLPFPVVRVGAGFGQHQAPDSQIVSGILAVVVLPERSVVRAELMADAEGQLRQPSRAGRGGPNGSGETLRKYHRLLVVVLPAA